ncbi:MAG: LamG-like jellyroll fold domain-containing protein [Bacteroidota bacterium]
MIRSHTPSSPTPVRVSCPSPPDHEWHFYAAVKDSSMIRLYIDGVQIDAVAYLDSGMFDQSIDHVEIGRHTYNGAIKGSFKGVIDEVQIYACPLSSVDIQTLYKQGSPPLSIHSETPELLLSLYPNPGKDRLVIRNNLTHSLDVELFSITGQLIHSIELDKEYVMDTSDLPTAVYTIRASHQQGYYFFKWLKYK